MTTTQEVTTDVRWDLSDLYGGMDDPRIADALADCPGPRREVPGRLQGQDQQSRPDRRHARRRPARVREHPAGGRQARLLRLPAVLGGHRRSGARRVPAEDAREGDGTRPAAAVLRPGTGRRPRRDPPAPARRPRRRPLQALHPEHAPVPRPSAVRDRGAADGGTRQHRRAGLGPALRRSHRQRRLSPGRPGTDPAGSPVQTLLAGPGDAPQGRRKLQRRPQRTQPGHHVRLQHAASGEERQGSPAPLHHARPVPAPVQ